PRAGRHFGTEAGEKRGAMAGRYHGVAMPRTMRRLGRRPQTHVRTARPSVIAITGSRTMVSHRRPGVLARALRLHRPPKAVISAPRRPGIELVDARTRVAHRVSPEALLAGRQRGDYEALCGARLLAASLTDPGRGQCPGCAS
ncbi:MAG: hypothetical protein ACRDS0_30175, partial [Pseudonocardiaceae bacterium]